MAGPVEVEAVTHIFSHETGFITEIKPSALVSANEVSTWPIIEALKAYQLMNRDMKEGKFGADVASLATEGMGPTAGAITTAIMSDELSLWQVWEHMGSDNADKWRKYLKNRYGIAVVEEGEDISEVYGDHYRKGTYQMTSDGTKLNQAQLLKEMGPSYHMRDPSYPSYVRPVAILGGTFGGLLAAGITRRISMGAFGWGSKSLIKWGRQGNKATEIGMGKKANWFTKALGKLVVGTSMYAGGSAGSTAMDAMFRTEDSQTTSQSLMTWFVSGPILFAKCMEEEVIQIVPLTMNGRPMVSGLTTRDPILRWKNKVGQIVNDVADTIDGTFDTIRDFKAEGYSFWRTMDKYWDREVDDLQD